MFQTYRSILRSIYKLRVARCVHTLGGCSTTTYLRHVKEPEIVGLEVAVFGRNYRPFLAQVVPPFTTRVSGGDTWRCK